jgi:hypothetical protein
MRPVYDRGNLEETATSKTSQGADLLDKYDRGLDPEPMHEIWKDRRAQARYLTLSPVSLLYQENISKPFSK